MIIGFNNLLISFLFEFKKLKIIAQEDHEEHLPRWTKDITSKLLSISLPLGIVIFLVSLNANIPRYMIDEQLGGKELGIFAGIYAVLNAASLPLAAVLQPLAPRLAESYRDNDRKRFIKLTIFSSICGALLSIMILVATLTNGTALLEFVLGPEFSQYPKVMILLSVALGLQYVAPFGVQLTAMKCRKPQLPAQAITTLTTAIVTFFSLKAFGLVGAAYGICIGNLVRLFILGLILKREIGNHFC